MEEPVPATEVRATCLVIDVGALRRYVALVEAEDAQHVHQRAVKVAGGQLERLPGPGRSVGEVAEGVAGQGGLEGPWHDDLGRLRVPPGARACELREPSSAELDGGAPGSSTVPACMRAAAPRGRA